MCILCKEDERVRCLGHVDGGEEKRSDHMSVNFTLQWGIQKNKSYGYSGVLLVWYDIMICNGIMKNECKCSVLAFTAATSASSTWTFLPGWTPCFPLPAMSRRKRWNTWCRCLVGSDGIPRTHWAMSHRWGKTQKWEMMVVKRMRA